MLFGIFKEGAASTADTNALYNGRKVGSANEGGNRMKGHFNIFTRGPFAGTLTRPLILLHAITLIWGAALIDFPTELRSDFALFAKDHGYAYSAEITDLALIFWMVAVVFMLLSWIMLWFRKKWGPLIFALSYTISLMVLFTDGWSISLTTPLFDAVGFTHELISGALLLSSLIEVGIVRVENKA